MYSNIDHEHVLQHRVVQNILSIAESFAVQALLDRNEGHDPITSSALNIVIHETHQYERTFHVEFSQYIAEMYKKYPLNFQIKFYCEYWLKECSLNAKRHKFRTDFLMSKLDTDENMILLISNSYLMGFYQEMHEKVLEYVIQEYPELFDSLEKR